MQVGNLTDHPEGGRFREVFRSAKVVESDTGTRSALTHIYFSLGQGEVSRFHRVENDEIWNLYEGKGVLIYVWDDAEQILVIHELSAASRTFCCAVEAGKWQAAIPLDSDVLVGCSVAPGFEFDDFTLIEPAGEIAKRILKDSPELKKFIFKQINSLRRSFSVSELPGCPECGSEYTYEDREVFVCPECAHEWSANEPEESADENVIRDANGNVLNDGDSVTVIKDLKVKGSSLVVKVGTKVRNIRLVDGDHDIDCKIDGIGAMKLKSEFVKKA
jgi:protein PhnA